MRRALIVGCGYVGTRLAVELDRDGWEVYGARRRVERLPERVRPLPLDVTRPDRLRDLPRDPDLTVYAVSPDERSEEAYRRAYVEGVSNLLEAFEADGSRPHRLVFVSSTAVYGHADGERVDEETPPRPEGYRGRILREAEEVVLGATGEGLRMVVRLGGIYGPGRTRLVERVRRGEARCPPDPPVYSNRIHRDDAAGILRHLADLGSPAPLYLGVDEEPAPLCRVLRWLARETGSPDPARESASAPGVRRRRSKRCSSERIRRSGYTFRFPTFREGYAELL